MENFKSIGDLVRHLMLKEEFLATEVTKDDMLLLSRILDDWRTFGRTAGLSEADIVAIQNDGVNEEDRRFKTFEAWHNSCVFFAHYHKLFEILFKMTRFDIILKVCNIPRDVSIYLEEEEVSLPVTIELLKQQYNLSEDQFHQQIPDYLLFDIAVCIPKWLKFADMLGLNDKDKLHIRRDNKLCTNFMRSQRALEIWYRRDPHKATFGEILSVFLLCQDVEVAVKIIEEVLLVNQEELTVCGGAQTEKKKMRMVEHISSIDQRVPKPTRQVRKFDDETLAINSLKLMKMEFGIVYSCLRRAMQQRNILASDLMSHLIDIEMFGPEMRPHYTNAKDVTLGTALSLADDSPTLDSLFHLMAPYCSWFNHLLVENIIKVYFIDNDEHYIHQILSVFKSKFQDYCKNRRVDVDQDFGPVDKSRCTYVCFKIDREWDNIRVEHLPHIIESLAEALDARKENLILCTVQDGCLEIVIAMPVHFEKKLFPLQAKVHNALKDVGVLMCKPHKKLNVNETALVDFNESNVNETALVVRRIAAALRIIGDSEHQIGQFDLMGPYALRLPTTRYQWQSFSLRYGAYAANIVCFAIPYLLRLNYRYTAVFRCAGAVVALALEYRSACLTMSTSGRVDNLEVLNPKVVRVVRMVEVSSNVGILVGYAMIYGFLPRTLVGNATTNALSRRTLLTIPSRNINEILGRYAMTYAFSRRIPMTVVLLLTSGSLFGMGARFWAHLVFRYRLISFFRNHIMGARFWVHLVFWYRVIFLLV